MKTKRQKQNNHTFVLNLLKNMKTKKLLFYFIALCFTLKLQAQNIKAGEKLTYSASYNMGGMMTQLAQVIMETENVATSKNNYLHLSCQAATYSKWDSFFKIRDLYESYVNPVTLRPNLYKRNIFEGGYTKKEKYVFKNGGKTIASTVNKKNMPQREGIFNINPSSMDAITLLYKVRTIDFNKLKPNQTLSFIVVFDEKEIPVVIKYLGKEATNAGNLGNKECYKIAIAAKTSALKGKDKNLIWLTADAKKVPVHIKFSIPVGTGQLTLTNASGI